MAEGHVEHSVAGLGATDFASFMHAVVAAAAQGRGKLAPPAAQDEFDIIDPYRLSANVYRESADAIEANVARIAGALSRLAGP
ncbi:hypothetical protein GCM10009640_11330 [Agrococcus citreus]|uniref:Uncharacterized protein n=2 Tax=Agrococcus citreus TaxID=84643 RepID=A0ABN1YRV3_9MICO